MFRKIYLFTCVLVLFMIVGGGCVVSSPQYHIDMYCGRTEIKSMPLARYWFCTWGTWDNFNENLVAVPFAVPLFLPVGISLDIVTDMALCPLDLFLSFALEEENTFSLIEENDAFYISLPERKPSIAYSSSFGEDCRLLLLKIHKGGISIKGDVSVYGSGEKEGVWIFTENELIIERGTRRNVVSYENGTGILLVLGRNFTPIPNPLPLMQQRKRGYQLYTDSLGFFSLTDCDNLKEALAKKTWMMHGRHVTGKHSRLVSFLDSHYLYFEKIETQIRTRLVEAKADSDSKITLKLSKTKDFQGSIVDLGLVSDNLRDIRKINTDLPEKNHD